jgi:hypothetical protein
MDIHRPKVAKESTRSTNVEIQQQNEHLRHTKHVEMHNLSHIEKDISLGYDTTGEIIMSTIRQMLMDDVDVEGEPIFHSIERTMKNNTNRALFLEPNNDLFMTILDHLESWMSKKFEYSDDPKASRENEHVKVFATTIEQRKSQQHDQFGAYAKFMVKKLFPPNPNEVTDEFDYAPSRQEKRQMNLSYAAVVTTLVQRSFYSESEMDNMNLMSEEPPMLTGFKNVSKLLELENSIKSIELDRISLNGNCFVPKSQPYLL